MDFRAVVVPSLALALACGGGAYPPPAVVASPVAVEAPAAAETQYGSIAFKSYRGAAGTLEFKSDTTVDYWWDNIPYSAPHGTYTHVGDEIEVRFDGHPEWPGLTMKLRQIDGCSMAQYDFQTTDGKHDDTSYMYEQKKPKCKL